MVEHVKLAYPMRALCERGEACRGLCSNCGAPVNELPAEITHCPHCHRILLGPVAGDQGDAGLDAESPLAAALKKIQLE